MEKYKLQALYCSLLTVYAQTTEANIDERLFQQCNSDNLLELCCALANYTSLCITQAKAKELEAQLKNLEDLDEQTVTAKDKLDSLIK